MSRQIAYAYWAFAPWGHRGATGVCRGPRYHGGRAPVLLLRLHRPQHRCLPAQVARPESELDGASDVNRKLNKRQVREAQSALADIGDQLLRIRDLELFRADGCETWEEYRRLRAPGLCLPAWRLTAARADELIEAAIAAAEQRRGRAA